MPFEAGASLSSMSGPRRQVPNVRLLMPTQGCCFLYGVTDFMIYIDVRPEGVWDDYHIADGRLVTGTNPQSAKSTAKAALEVFAKL